MKTVMTGCKPRQRSERPTLPEKNLTIQLDLFTAQKTDGTPRGEHREEVEQNVVQDSLEKKSRLWQVVLLLIYHQICLRV